MTQSKWASSGQDVPVYWGEYLQYLASLKPAHEQKVMSYRARKIAEYNKLSPFKKVLKHLGDNQPDGIWFNINVEAYAHRHYPKIEPSIEGYYTWRTTIKETNDFTLDAQ